MCFINFIKHRLYEILFFILQKILKYFASQPNTKNLITSKLLILIFKDRQHLTWHSQHKQPGLSWIKWTIWWICLQRWRCSEVLHAAVIHPSVRSVSNFCDNEDIPAIILVFRKLWGLFRLALLLKCQKRALDGVASKSDVQVRPVLCWI